MVSCTFYISGSSETSRRTDGHYAAEDGSIVGPASAHKKLIDLEDIAGVVNYYATPHIIGGKTEYHHVRLAVMKDGRELALMEPSSSKTVPENIAKLDQLPQLVSSPSQQASTALLLQATIANSAPKVKIGPALRR